MAIEQFTVQIQGPDSVVLTTTVAIMFAIGVVFIVMGLLNRIKTIAFTHNNRYTVTIGGIALVAVAIVVFFVNNAPSTVTIGSGYIDVQFAGYSPNLPIPFISGNMNVNSSQIVSAFVGKVGSGDFTLDKQIGTNSGNINIGSFTLGNGATAYVASNNSTNLIIKLNNGQYLILGTSNTDALATSFSQNVYPLASP